MIGMRCSSANNVPRILQGIINVFLFYMSDHNFIFQKKNHLYQSPPCSVVPLFIAGSSIMFVTHVKFLGLTFDKRMTWRYHVDLRRRCVQVLAQMAKLLHLRWRADRDTLLYLHRILDLSDRIRLTYLWTNL